MLEWIRDLVLDESKWMFGAMSFSLVVVAPGFFRRPTDSSNRAVILVSLSTFYGCTVFVMGIGHLLAVTLKQIQGTLEVSFLLMLLLGFALVLPSGWLVLRSRRIAERPRLVAPHAWLGITLLALGVHNWPLAVPAMLNIAYERHSRRETGWAIVAVAVLLQLGLFVGSIVFFASGQTFEQFKGIE